MESKPTIQGLQVEEKQLVIIGLIIVLADNKQATETSL